MKKIIKATRAPFLTAVVIPVLLGTAVAKAAGVDISILNFVIALIGAMFFHAGANVANDYFDTKSGCDQNNPNRTPFSGGSAVIINKEFTANQILALFIFYYALTIACGAFLAYRMGNLWYVILILGLLGFALGYFYTAPPFRLAHHGLGELAVGIAFGPITLFGAYFVQAKAFSFVPIIVSIPVAILIILVLWINQFPDREPDMSVNKNHFVARLGLKKSYVVYVALLVFTYLSVILFVALKLISIYAGLVLLTLPLAIKAITHIKKNLDNVKALIPAQGLTIKLHLIIGLILAITIYFGS